MNTRLVPVFACAVLSIVGGTGSASAAVVENFHSKGEIAAAVCSKTQVVDCGDGFISSIQTDVFVSGEEFKTRSRTSPTDAHNNLFVTVRQINGCTNEFSGSVGSLPDASTQQNLQSAELQGVVALNDIDTGAPAGTMAVDVTFEGAGAIVLDRFRIRFDFEDPPGTTIVIAART